MKRDTRSKFSTSRHQVAKAEAEVNPTEELEQSVAEDMKKEDKPLKDLKTKGRKKNEKASESD